jgi:hypothetical protein
MMSGSKRDWSNLITMALTTVILVSGIALPNLIYPRLDNYRGQVRQLQNSDTGIILGGLPSLYPWSLYDIGSTRPISVEERQRLMSKEVAETLLGIINDCGMPTGDHEELYRSRLLNSFRYLVSSEESESPCFVMPACDIDLDGVADLRCATSLSGEIISCLILNNRWTKMHLLPDDQTDENNGQIPDSGSDTDNSSENGLDSNTSSEEKPGSISPFPPTFGREPTQEHHAIWSFSYSISRHANFSGQNLLADSFERIDLGFCYNYHYSFENLLRVQNGLSPKPDSPELETVYGNSNLNLTPQEWPYDQYVLYIYAFDDGGIMIIYISAESRDFVGFIIQSPART